MNETEKAITNIKSKELNTIKRAISKFKSASKMKTKIKDIIYTINKNFGFCIFGK